MRRRAIRLMELFEPAIANTDADACRDIFDLLDSFNQDLTARKVCCGARPRGFAVLLLWPKHNTTILGVCLCVWSHAPDAFRCVWLLWCPRQADLCSEPTTARTEL